MTDLVASWENWRRSWYKYEDIIVDLINNYQTEESWLGIIKFIARDLNIDYTEYKIKAEKSPKSVENAFWWAKKPPKADIIIFFEDKITWERFFKWISAKSSNINIQVLITNVSAFLEVCENYWIDIPNWLDVALSKFCWFWEYKPSLMLSKNEIDRLIQWDRDRWLIYELDKDEQNIIKDFFNENQEEITEIVLKKWSSFPEYRADYYLVNKTKFSDTREVDFWIDNIRNVIDRCIEHWWYIVTEKWSFHIWSITVQMKWSWQWEAYHGLQFNKAWI